MVPVVFWLLFLCLSGSLKRPLGLVFCCFLRGTCCLHCLLPVCLCLFCFLIVAFCAPLLFCGVVLLLWVSRHVVRTMTTPRTRGVLTPSAKFTSPSLVGLCSFFRDTCGSHGLRLFVSVCSCFTVTVVGSHLLSAALLSPFFLSANSLTWVWRHFVRTMQTPRTGGAEDHVSEVQLAFSFLSYSSPF